MSAASNTLNRSFVAEIIGPAGAGKSTLSRLLRGNDQVRTGFSVWRLPMSLLAVSALGSLPNLWALGRHSSGFGWDELKLVIQYNALLRVLNRESANGNYTLLLDEGSLFALAKLCSSGRHDGGDKSFAWMNSLLNKLAATLDAVIWLDAPDSVLARRIREREKMHDMKDKSDVEIENHVARYRSSFEQVVAEVSRRKNNGLKVFRFSTDQISLEEIAAKVLSEARVRV